MTTPVSKQTKATDLVMGEQLVLWAFRTRLAAGDADTGRLAQGFRLAFGLARVEEALADFEAIFTGINQHLTRDMCFACKCLRQLTADEVTVLNLFAACQHGSVVHARHILTWLVAADMRSVLIDRIVDFTMLMEDVGLMLPRRAGSVPRLPSPAVPLEEVTVH